MKKRKDDLAGCPCEGCVWHEGTIPGCECTFPSHVPHDHVTDGCCENYEREGKGRKDSLENWLVAQEEEDEWQKELRREARLEKKLPLRGLKFALGSLSFSANCLCSFPNIPHLRLFLEQLKRTEGTINRNASLIPETHSKELKMLIQAFRDFKKLEEDLIKIHGYDQYHYQDIWLTPVEEKERIIEKVIEEIKQTKEQYDQLIMKISTSFKG
jgi:hypothetical protein